MATSATVDSGGWDARNWFNGYQQRRDIKKQERQASAGEIKDLQGKDGEIARLMHSIIESIPGRFLESEAGDNERPTSVHDRS